MQFDSEWKGSPQSQAFAQKIVEEVSVHYGLPSVEEKYRTGSSLLADNEPWTQSERQLAEAFEVVFQELQYKLLADALRVHRQGVADALQNMAMKYGRPEFSDVFQRNGNTSPPAVPTSHVVLDLDDCKWRPKAVGAPSPAAAQNMNREVDVADTIGRSVDFSVEDPKFSSDVSSTPVRLDRMESEYKREESLYGKRLTVLAKNLHGLDVLETPLEEFVCSSVYTIIICVIIVVHAVIMGIEAHLEMRYEINRVSNLPYQPVPDYFRTLQVICSGFFLVDVVFRLCVLKEKFLWANDPDNRGWNIFDLVVVIISLPDFFPSHSFFEFSMFRAFRLMRVIRVIHVARGVRELRKMVFALVHSMSALFWLGVLMFIFIYIFALVFIKGAIDDLSTWAPVNTTDTTDVRRLKSRGGGAGVSGDSWYTIHPYEAFNGMGLTMRSLFNVIVGNEDWISVLRSVSEVNFFYGIASMLFSVFFFFGFMNVATGLFVDKAITIASLDKDFVLKEQVEKQKEQVETMKKLFCAADANNDGSLTITELKAAILHPDVRSWLASIEIDIADDIDAVLAVLDPNNDGCVDTNEFYAMIVRLKGQARSVELMMSLMEARRMRKQLDENHKQMSEEFTQVHVLIDQLRTCMDDMVKSKTKKYDV